jgi:hypothetical protein
MEPKEKEEKGKKKTTSTGEEWQTVDVMRFNIRVKDGKAFVGDKAQALGEDKLKAKFGSRYEDVKHVFEEALKEWKGKEDELAERGFGMYEDFRPSVSAGTKGWGRKGELDLQRIRDVVSI